MSSVRSKVFILFLVAVFVLASFAGCKGKGGDETSTTAPPAGTTTTKATTTTEEPTTTVKDLGGRHFIVHTWGNEEPSPGNPRGDELIARRAEFEEKYNFTFELILVPQEEVQELATSSIIGGEPYADICSIDFRRFYPGLVTKGFALPAQDLFDFTDEKWSKIIRDNTTFGGNTYGFDATGNIWYPRTMVFFNKDILDREGLEYPYELQANKQWTWEKLREYAKACTKDTDGDGVIDQWGIGVMNWEIPLIYSNGAPDIIADFDNGTADFGWDDPKAIKALEFWQELALVDKVIYQNQPGDPWDKARALFQEGKLAFYFYSFWVVEGFATDMEDDYGLLLFPIGPDMDHYTTVWDATPFMYLPNGAKNVEDIAWFWDMWTEPTQAQLADPDAWRTNYSRYTRDEESLDTLWMLWQIDDVIVYKLGSFEDAQSAWWNVRNQISNSEKSIAQVMEEQAPAIQAAIDDVLASLK